MVKIGTKEWWTAFTWMGQRKRAYQLALKQPAGQMILIDLAKFCRADETCFHEDARKHAVLEGRREVWLRIQQHLNLTTEQLMALYSGNQFNAVEEKDSA